MLHHRHPSVDWRCPCCTCSKVYCPKPGGRLRGKNGNVLNRSKPRHRRAHLVPAKEQSLCLGWDKDRFGEPPKVRAGLAVPPQAPFPKTFLRPHTPQFLPNAHPPPTRLRTH